MPVTLIGESVFARCLSSLYAERQTASKILKGPTKTKFTGSKGEFIENIRKVKKKINTFDLKKKFLKFKFNY